MPDTKAGAAPPYKPGADGELHRTWNGKLPEEFTRRILFLLWPIRIYSYTGRCRLTLAAIHAAGYDYQGGAVVPMPGKENRNMSKDVILTPEQIAAEEKRWLFEVPIAELAEVKGVSIDEAVQMRIDANLQNAAPKLEVSARPITPMGNLLGFASVKINDCFVVEDFKILQTAKGLYVGCQASRINPARQATGKPPSPLPQTSENSSTGPSLKPTGKKLRSCRPGRRRQTARRKAVHQGPVRAGAKQAAKKSLPASQRRSPPKGRNDDVSGPGEIPVGQGADL